MSKVGKERSGMAEGIVKRINVERGYAFIEQVAGPDVFLHISSLDRSIPWDSQLTGRRLRFDLVDAPRGPEAKNATAAD